MSELELVCVEVINDCDLRAIGRCGAIIRELEENLFKHHQTLKDFMRCYVFNDFGYSWNGKYVSHVDKCHALIKSLVVEFRESTNGLTLAVGFHDSKGCGSEEDEVDGGYWGGKRRKR